MSAIPYKSIRSQLSTILQADATLNDNARIYVEEEPNFGLSDKNAIAVFFDGRRATSDQSIASGKRTTYELRHSFWTVAFSMESFSKAADARDDLVGQLELVLMANRKINNGSQDLVETSWLEGGQVLSAKTDSGAQCFVAMAETVLVSRVTASNA